MSYPAEGVEATYKNNIDAVRATLDERHQNHYAVYNISPRQYNPAKYELKLTFGSIFV